jgi:hypothetical protein
MAITKTHSSAERGGIGAGAASVSIASEGADDRQVLLPPGTLDKEIDLDFVYTALKSFFMNCTGLDDGVTITLRTNSTGAPAIHRPRKRAALGSLFKPIPLPSHP